MATLTRERTTIELNPGDKAKLEEVARSLGYLRSTTQFKGQGSISQLMQAIASGEVQLKKKNC